MDSNCKFSEMRNIYKLGKKSVLYVLYIDIKPVWQPLWPATGSNINSRPLSLSCQRAWRRRRGGQKGSPFTHGSTRWRAGWLHKHTALIRTHRNRCCTPLHPHLHSKRRMHYTQSFNLGSAPCFTSQVLSWRPIKPLCVCSNSDRLIQLGVNPTAADRFNQQQRSAISGTVEVTCRGYCFVHTVRGRVSPSVILLLNTWKRPHRSSTNNYH